MSPRRAAGVAVRPDDRLARLAERTLRGLGDTRVALALLLATGIANVLAALVPDGSRLLEGWPYALLLGALALSAVASVAVRAPAAWRECRPGAVHPGPEALSVVVDSVLEPPAIVERLRTAGYRSRIQLGRGRWAVHAVRRGWSRFAAHLAHLAVVGIVLGVAVGAAFGSETTFSLHPGDQALLDAPRPGFSSAVRLNNLDAEFGPDGRPRRLDVTVTFLRAGSPVEERLLRVNEPAAFDGYLVHPWTYGPAARLRVETLGGGPLLDSAVPLAGDRDGVPVGSLELPTVGASLGLALADASAATLGVSLVDGGGLVDSARLRPGEEQRLGSVVVRLDGFDAWVTLMARRDPGLPIVFAGAVLLCVSLGVAFWLPRRRVTVSPERTGTRIILRGERFDRPTDELDRLRARLEARG